VVLEPGTGVSKGVGYVSFAIKEDAQSAFDTISNEGIELDRRKLRVQWADTKVGMTSNNITIFFDISTI
jgi:nucleolar protein 4